jgi:hypothetical protein
VDQRPALDGTPVAGLPISVFGLQDERGINGKMQRRFVLKADLNRMALAGGEDLDKIDQFAFGLFKAIERAPTVAADLWSCRAWFQ